jgi:hypothetical protein
MSRIPATAKELRRSAARLRFDSRSIKDDSSRLLLFYSVECRLKERYIVEQLANPSGDTLAIPLETDGPFGSTGHDLAAACKALRAPATLPPTPHLFVHGQAKSMEYAHQVWRYGIKCSRAETLEEWLNAVASWLESRQ